MKLHQLKRSKGLKDKQRRLGRGNATGSGNYSTKGLKGQKARSGHSMKPFFEGGQTSLVMRLPKAKGFKRHFKLVEDIAIVNLGVLENDDRVADNAKISKSVLKDLGYIKNVEVTVKVLGNGNYSKHIEFVDIEKFSKSAKDKIDNPANVTEKKSSKIVKVAKTEKKVKTTKTVKPANAVESKEDKPAKKAVAKK